MADGAGLGVHESRTLLARARTLVDLVDTIENGRATLRGDVEKTFHVLREQMVHRELANIPVGRLRDTTGGRLRIGPLEQAGVTTVLDVHGSSASRLQQVPGVGQITATQLVAAARQVATAVRDDLRVRVDLNPSDAASTALISALHTLREFEGAAEQAHEPASRLAKDLDAALPVAAATGSRLRRFFSGRERQADAQAAMVRIQQLVAWTESSGLAESLGGAATALRGVVDPKAAWEQFERRSPEFYGLLGEIVELGGDAEAAVGFLPTDLVEQITSHPLDDGYRRVSLRGYQAFGARFALARRRVIIGDEMGLGKTIQAIAVMTHLRTTGAQRFLVACPASVLVNWTREISDRSELRAYRLHGLERAANQRLWERQGGVGVTTLDSLYSLTVPADVRVDQLVVDEAHFVKNPEARRSRAVRAWTERVDRVLFLTGTPMENRAEEFRNLVGYLQPKLASAVDGRHGVAGPTAFRRAVAPVYLRRNQDDVLMELPDLVRSDDWVEFGRADHLAYRDAVAQGNFMAMRRAAYASGTPGGSAKLTRLLEIVEESAANGHKVVVFTNFRDVLSTVGSALDGRAFGPIAGDVPAAQRQAIVDQFAAADGHAVLLAQVQAGGTGLNIQAASVVILCEPQVKPSLEDQAIARLHRMGQTRSVQAHRLLVADSVDQRMVEMLAAKALLFDDYARRSDMADGSPDAVDVSEVELARRIVAEEQERFARDAMARQVGPPTAGTPQ
jgi:superfamily II DNA or RNA helicase